MDCQQLKSSITDWFGSEIECHVHDSGVLTAVLPIFQPNGDAIEVGVQSLDQTTWKISDLGITHHTLYLGGVDVSDEESERTDEFKEIVNDFGVSDDGSELTLVASGHLGEHVFDFVSAIQNALALQLTVKRQLPARDFASIVAKYLGENQARFFVPNEPTAGKTGKWRFNFSFRNGTETLVKTMTTTTPAGAMLVSKQGVFEMRDVREVRPKEKFVTVIDDEGDREAFWKQRVTRVFAGYDIPVIRWATERAELLMLAQG
ncbi:MAG: DUF1828 domain-containing protein [Terriglobales bacterium]|jgi:putative NIF3 family GTP cyclohydrolase 1 type 2